MGITCFPGNHYVLHTEVYYKRIITLLRVSILKNKKLLRFGRVPFLSHPEQVHYKNTQTNNLRGNVTHYESCLQSLSYVGCSVTIRDQVKHM